uniref:Uncharacterized protein n=1 Tax=Setaria viridis TaxID=4556 RepID=A0A4U6UEA3_SETVI|nr:hypothetical protein SEVIR_5G164500v2 [Setaria viridis]
MALLLWFASTIVVRWYIKRAEKYCSRHYGGTDSVPFGNLVSKLLFNIHHELKEQLYEFTAFNPHQLCLRSCKSLL